MDATVTFDGKTHFPVIVAESVDHVGEILRKASAENQAIFPLGGQTSLALGNSPSRPGWGLDLRRLDRVIDYPAPDMTITVQAGITLERLSTILREKGQQLAIDPPLPRTATLGGAIAKNASGSRRYGYGTLRDAIIGITVVNDEGQEVKAGGRVVKNVAGYDLMKLYIGSLGTLGIVSQVTLKVKPLTEASEWHILPCNSKSARDIIELLHETKTRPVAIDMLNQSAQRATSWPEATQEAMMVIGYEGNAAAVRWQAEQLYRELPTALRAHCQTLAPDATTSMLAQLRDFAGGSHGGVSFKANLVPSAVGKFFEVAGQLPLQPLLFAHVGNGIIHGRLVPGTTLEQAQTSLAQLGQVAANASGNLIITRCAAEWKTALPVWGRATGDRQMMRIVKDTLDPHGLFNPGRFVDGI